MTKFSLFGRVLSGSIKAGDQVRCLGEGYTPDDEEDQSFQSVDALHVYQSRYLQVFDVVLGTRLVSNRLVLGCGS
jgi:U5 small nuclear ribonucleoprotein component